MTGWLTWPDSNFAQSLFLYLPRESHFTQITTRSYQLESNSEVVAKLTLTPVVHSENPADHEHLAELFAARLALAESETERQGMDKFAQSEKEHCE